MTEFATDRIRGAKSPAVDMRNRKQIGGARKDFHTKWKLSG